MVEKNNGSHITQWSTAIARIGIPGAIAIWVVYVGTQQLPRLVDEVHGLRQEVVNQNELLREQARLDERKVKLLQWICAGIHEKDQRCFE